MRPIHWTIAFALVAGTPAVAQDAEGLTVVFAEDSNSDTTFDPRVTQSRHEEQVITQMFDQLAVADSGGKIYPGLAKSWEVSDDQTSITFTLRDDVTFHDGTPFNAEAVKFTLDSIKDPALGSQGAVDIMGPYASSEVLDAYTIKVNYERPFPAGLGTFTENELSPVSPTAVKEKGDNGFAQAPVGTGPFKFVSWEKGREVVLERNEDYNWAPEFMDNEGPSKVARVIHRYVPDASTRVAALEAGEVQVTDLTPPLDMQRLSGSSDFQTIVAVASGVPFSAPLNTSKGPFADPKVRQAFMYSINRPALADSLFFGFADAAYGPISSATPEYFQGVEEYYPYDPDKAAALLDEAGWAMGSGGIREKDGAPLSIYFPALMEPETAVALQAEARKAGFDVTVENVLKQKQDELILNNEYDMLVLRWVLNDPAVMVIPYHSRNIPEPGTFKFNWSRYSNPELDKLLTEAAAATTPQERQQLYADAQKLIMDEALVLPIHDQIQSIAYSADLDGIRFAPGNWQVRLYDVRPAAN